MRALEGKKTREEKRKERRTPEEAEAEAD